MNRLNAITESQILYEDNHLIAVAKPAGIATMGAVAGTPSLVELTKEYIKRKYKKPGNVFLGVVSRIDSFVSGAIVFARTSKAAARLTKQFKESTVTKTYFAVVEGTLAGDGEFETWLRKNERLHCMESFSKEVEGSKFAKLTYRLLKTAGEFSAVEIDLVTGRKHQIRVQFSDSGYPVFGDKKYGGVGKLGNAIALHAKSLKLEHPTLREPLVIQCDLPNEWRKNPVLSRII